MIKGLIPILLAIFLTGCTTYPAAGTGGAAELYDSPFFPAQRVEAKGPVTTKDILELRLMLARNYLLKLQEDGANYCLPAAWYTVQLLAQRVTREIAGGFITEAYDDQIVLEKQIDDMVVRMNYITDKVTCTPMKRRSPLQA